MKRVLLWLRRIALAFAIGLVVPGVVGASYQLLTSAVDKRIFPPPGWIVDVGGYKMHVACAGEGTPIVILDSASIDTVSGWYWVQSEVSKTTRVCAYDRPGMGWSDPGPEPHDAWQNAAQLHTLLERIGAQGPYVLVGHSFGGLYVRTYAARYPDQVAGIVLIEATHPDFPSRLGQPEVMPNADARMLSAGPVAARLGLLRLVDFIPVDPDLPARQQAELGAYYASNKFADRMLTVYREFPEILAQARSVDSLGDIPLITIIGSRSENADGVLRELQDELLNLSTNSQQRLVDGATHMSLVHSEAHAKETSAAIRDVVEMVRGGSQPALQ